MRKTTLVIAAVGVAIAVAIAAFALVRGDSDGSARTEQPMSTTTGMEGMEGMEGMDGAAARTPAEDLPEIQPATPTRMGDLVLPPGMVMAGEMNMEAMRDMAAAGLDVDAYTAPANVLGDRPLAARSVDGVREYRLETSVIGWSILRDVQVAAYAFNRQVPGPRLTLTQGEPVRIVVRNDLPEATSVHWHGLVLPNAMDGASDVTQKPIPPGGTFTYEFTPQQAGTFFYHSHKAADRQQALGLYGALIVKPRRAAAEPSYDLDVPIQLQEWTFKAGYTFPSMPMEGLLPNFFTINGKSYPDTETVRAKVGDRIRFRFIGSSTAFAHPMHIHGGPFEIVGTDGEPVPAAARLRKDTVNVAPGERWDVIWTARRPGKWLLHCHILHHTTNDNVEVDGGGGLTMVIDVS